MERCRRGMSTDDVDAVLFDLGGVVFEIHFERAFSVWAGCSGEPQDALASRFSFDRSYERHERGEIDAHQYFAVLRSTLGTDLTDAELAEGSNSIYGDEYDEMDDLLRRLAEAVPVYAFTNSNPTHQEVWERKYRSTLSRFRSVFVSSEMGVRKPEPRSYRAVAEKMGIAPERVLFFDDTPENVKGAAAVGMPAVHVRSVEDVSRGVAGLLRTGTGP